MNVTKFGETYNISKEYDSYKVSGDLIKTVNGNVIINVGTVTKDDERIANLNGTYQTVEGEISYTFRAPINRYEEQVLIIDEVIEAIKTIV